MGWLKLEFLFILGLGLGLRLGASARDRARTHLELGLGLVRVSCIMTTWFQQNSAVMCRFPSGSCTGQSKE